VRTSVVAGLVVFAFVVGYWAGGAANDSFHDRAGRARTDDSAAYATDLAREVERTQLTLGKRIHELRDENEQLRDKLAVLEQPAPDETTAEPGTRLADGTIVGGARWNDGFHRLATGFLDTMLSNFIRNAELSPQQEQRVRSLILRESGKFLQVSADFTNGDIDGEDAYEQLEGLSTDLRSKVGEMLNDEQRANFGNLQRGIRSMMRDQIVHNEMATLKSTLRLDSDQEAKIAAIVAERYKRVEDKTNIPIPNVFFKPLRRASDKAIYDETADAIRAVLDAEQMVNYDEFEAQAPAAPFQYRPQLVAK
jgi:hypothetical protein